jgi:hypothetical protein
MNETSRERAGMIPARTTLTGGRVFDLMVYRSGI